MKGRDQRSTTGWPSKIHLNNIDNEGKFIWKNEKIEKEKLHIVCSRGAQLKFHGGPKICILQTQGPILDARALVVYPPIILGCPCIHPE